MRRIALFVLSTLSTLVLLLGYNTSTSGPLATSAPTSIQSGPITSSSGSTSESASGSTSSGSTSSGSSSSGGTASGSGSPGSTDVTGSVADTQWGPVQVRLTLTGGTISKVTVLQYPSGNGKDQEINDYALPILTQETVDAQSAQIDMVSGATVTSNGYLESLQSALDQARL
ncbi:MAG TPA: FMN-binding protein [Marmoricola sp.]